VVCAFIAGTAAAVAAPTPPNFFLSLRLLALALLTLTGLPGNAAETAAPRPPNLLLILIDDMGWKDMGCSGSRYYETPHIDRLASQGMRCTNAYSAGIVCNPSRGAIYSGKFPARTKLTTPFIGPDGPDDRLHPVSKYQGQNHPHLEAMHRRVLPKDEVIFAQALSEGGYRTGFFGKWHVGECPGYYPDDRGFQVAKGYRNKAAGTSSSGHWMKTFHKYGANLEGVDRDAYLADVLTDKCVEFIRQQDDRPWLAVLSHYLVHDPVDPKPALLEQFKNKPTTDQNNPGYAAMMASVDESVGRLMKTLAELGVERDTLVIFTSDNGGLTPGHTSNYPMMGGKSFPFEAATKVPFIAHWPGRIKPGMSSERIVGTDIYPTMLAAAGHPQRLAQHVDGINLMPVLTDGATLGRRAIVCHNPHYTHAVGPFSSITIGNRKLIRFYNEGSGSSLLYNLADDPQEQHDLADKEPEVRQQLEDLLAKMLLEMDAEMPTPNPAYKGQQNREGFDLKFSKDLADKERRIFEERLTKPSAP
jgi:arylsulfatase A-like enzyme